MRNIPIRKECDCGHELIGKKEYEFMNKRKKNREYTDFRAVKQFCSVCKKIYWQSLYKKDKK